MAEKEKVTRRTKRFFRVVVECPQGKTIISAQAEASTVLEALREAYRKIASWEFAEETDITKLVGDKEI